jgi:ribosomal protein S18 acetylase RimI-like enzyme
VPVRIEYKPTALAFDEYHRLDGECFPSEPTDAQSFADALAHDFWAAWDGSTLVGFASVVRRSGLSLLSRIATAKTHRRRGVAAALMQAALEHCQQVGLPDTILYVMSDNLAALRLYERFGFRPVGSAWQFVLADPREDRKKEVAARVAWKTAGTHPSRIVATPISDMPQAAWPRFPEEWADLAQMHSPPRTYVFVFRQGETTAGYARLNPDFPGCFPFVVERPLANLMPAVASLRTYLLPGKSILKLTITEPQVAEACRRAGLQLNYELLKMMRRAGGA